MTEQPSKDYSSVPLEELVIMAQSGDLQAFDEIYLRFFAKVMGSCYLITNSEEDARDVAQNIFIHIYKKLNTLKSPKNFSSWLFRITRNMTLNFRQSLDERNRRRVVSIDESIEGCDNITLGETLQSDLPTSFENLQTEERENIFKCYISYILSTLTDTERQLFELRFYEKLKTKEIAEQLGISNGKVRSILYKILKKFKKDPKLKWLWNNWHELF